MKLLRWLAAGVLWILAGVVGLLGALLSVTIILLPVGIPLLLLARKLGAMAGGLLLPRAVKHPVKELSGKTGSAAAETRGPLKKSGKSVTDAVPAKDLSKKAKKKLKPKKKGLGRLT
jgi:hypothetical protein